MRSTYLPTAAVLAVLGVAVGCARDTQDSDTVHSTIRQLERRAVGPARPYLADTYGDADEKRFASSKKARRELGWRVLAKALAPVTVQAPVARTIPLFRTWLGGDELERMFAKMYDDLGKERRRARALPTAEEVSSLFEWNATSLGANSEDEYLARLGKVTDKEGLNGLGGNARSAYAPSYVERYFVDYPTMAGCRDKLESFTFATPEAAPNNFTNCMSGEFPTNAAVIKASWRRNDEIVHGLPIHDTSGPTLKQRLAGELDKGGWPQRGLPTKDTTPDEAYTVKLEGGEQYSLVGLHIMTKELRHWVWVSVWWSPDATKDFGQDRPEAIAALGVPWSNYKMCAVTDFVEGDPDPRGGFDGSLGDALEATHGTSSWCSNPFIEKGARNAQTNCIGCHQHAGDVAAFPAILEDETRFPLTGRARVRASFPADYSWAFATPDSPDGKDRFVRMLTARMAVYEPLDTP